MLFAGWGNFFLKASTVESRSNVFQGVFLFASRSRSLGPNMFNRLPIRLFGYLSDCPFVLLGAQVMGRIVFEDIKILLEFGNSFDDSCERGNFGSLSN